MRCVNPASDLKILQLRNKTGRASVLVQTSSVTGKTQENSTLVFNRYGDRHFFAQAWLVGDSIGMQARKSRSEKARACKLASVRATQIVALTSKR